MITKRFRYGLFGLKYVTLCLCLFVASLAQGETDVGDQKWNQVLDFDPVCGAVTPDSATFVVGLQHLGEKAKIVLSKQKSFVESIYSEEVDASKDNAGIVKIQVSSLEPDTRYYYNVEVNGEFALRHPQYFRTFPKGNSSFRFAFGNSMRLHRVNQNGMLASLKENPLFFLNTGDLHYHDITGTRPDQFREAIAGTFIYETHRKTMAKVPLVYMFDDHDYGPNDSDKTAPGRSASLLAYRQMIPHYPLINKAIDESIEQAFSVGRTRFILTDLRSNRSPKTDPDTMEKTMMGSRQRDWFLDELKSSSETHALVFWVSTVPWIQDPKVGADQWGGYTHERRIISDFISEHNIKNIVIIAGDAHSLSADNGTNFDYSTNGNMPAVPEIIASPLDNDATSVKGGPYSAGVYEPKKGENVYGLIEVVDSGDQITMKFYGKTHEIKTVIELEHTIQVDH